MEEFTINNNQEFIYRVRQLNAIQLLAIRSQMSFDTFDDAQNTFNLALQNLEVRTANSSTWLPVRDPKGTFFMPASLENDPEAIEMLVKKFMEYLKSVFHKSTELKSNIQ